MIRAGSNIAVRMDVYCPVTAAIVRAVRSGPSLAPVSDERTVADNEPYKLQHLGFELIRNCRANCAGMREELAG
jgi:hypothetical protein